MAKYIPNALTILRFLFIPFAIYFLLNDQYIISIFFILLSGITDILDGAIARKFNFITNFGKLIDPLADKITQLSILCTLVVKNIIPLWILIILLIKEATMVSGASFLYGKNLVVSSKWYGKSATALFYIAIVLSLIINQYSYAISNNSLLLELDKPFYYLAVLMAIFSLVMYFRAFYIQGYLKKESLKLNQKVDED